MDELIRKQDAIDALWKALFKYEDETEQKFQASDELNIDDWFMHRIFVQNMSDIDRQTIRDLPPVQPKRKTGYKINQHQYPAKWVCSECGAKHFDFSDNFCSQCGADMRGY